MKINACTYFLNYFDFLTDYIFNQLYSKAMQNKFREKKYEFSNN